MCRDGEAPTTLSVLKKSPATTKSKAKFVLATDGLEFHAEDLRGGDIIVCNYSELPTHFTFFLSLAGISTVEERSESVVDVKATKQLNRLYVELLRNNPEWGAPDRRHEMNHFLARLIFCFFAEDTNIFNKTALFTKTVGDLSARDSSDTHEVIGEIFRAMNTKPEDRSSANLADWANEFPYVNGGLFGGKTDSPYFSKIARSYLLHIGGLAWQEINPDIFGSMIQAVADEEERGTLGLHYTSVPNILRVLNPLFLDDLREGLEKAKDNHRKLLNLRNRIARIRIFDPACGSGNFLVVAYREMRAIEAEINARRGESERSTEIPLTNFFGIEVRDFATEIARLALIITKYQCDVRHRGQREALREVLPLESMMGIVRGNALQLDWHKICPMTGVEGTFGPDDSSKEALDPGGVDHKDNGSETYICGNPPYLGHSLQSDKQNKELKTIFGGRIRNWKSLDYVTGWFIKAAEYGARTECVSAFVSTNSICQGQQAPILWPLIFETGYEIDFAHTSFKWSNLASNNAGVSVVIIGISNRSGKKRRLYSVTDDGQSVVRYVNNINGYLISGSNLIVDKEFYPKSRIPEMRIGNKSADGGYLLLSAEKLRLYDLKLEDAKIFVRQIYGSAELIRGISRYCLWIENKNLSQALEIKPIRERIEKVREWRLSSKKPATQAVADRSHQFAEIRQTGAETAIVTPRVSSEARLYLPVGYVREGAIILDSAFALFDAPLWNMALVASRLHLVWIATVCGRLETRFRYSNTLGWNTFPVPSLSEQDKVNLTRCAEDILLAREMHFPATIADLYDPEKMPENLRVAHDHNDETLERIFIGRRFRNDTERLETLFDLYAKKKAEAEDTARVEPATEGAGSRDGMGP